MIVRFHPAALQEMREAEWYIEERRPGWGAKFRAEVAEVIRFVLERAHAHEGSRHGGTGSMKVRRFPYRVYYRILPDELRIRAVYHGKRKPAGWSGRKF
ncbi:MAG: type II toxin-antitoxin system RelE/ParE family toxin [Flavobacteriales bacterium]|nr:type II toxin-antitoxin system RelE/ParE family toxin [Flavobacteriales bacterium]